MPERRLALIIASSQYVDPDLQKLIAPAQDAEALANILKDPTIGDFEVRTLLDEPSYKVNEEIQAFFSDRGREDLLLLYFSCHGIKDEEGQLYFATSNTSRKLLDATAISANFVNRMMFRSRSRRQLLLLDCCYSGAFAKGLVSRADKKIHTGDYFDEGRGRIVLTASDSMQYSFEADTLNVEVKDPGSIFTRAIIEGLKTGKADLDQDGRISYDELYDYTYDRVIDETPLQKPGKWVFGVEGDVIVARNRNWKEVSKGSIKIAHEEFVEAKPPEPARNNDTRLPEQKTPEVLVPDQQSLAPASKSADKSIEKTKSILPTSLSIKDVIPRIDVKDSSPAATESSSTSEVPVAEEKITTPKNVWTTSEAASTKQPAGGPLFKKYDSTYATEELHEYPASTFSKTVQPRGSGISNPIILVAIIGGIIGAIVIALFAGGIIHLPGGGSGGGLTTPSTNSTLSSSPTNLTTPSTNNIPPTSSANMTTTPSTNNIPPTSSANMTTTPSTSNIPPTSPTNLTAPSTNTRPSISTTSNIPPLATPQSVSTTQNTPVTIRLAGSDSNRNATLTAQIVSAPSHGTLNNITQDTGDVTYTPNQDYTGDDSFTFKVNDGKVDSNNTAMVSIRVN
jgi:hypothetical protein